MTENKKLTINLNLLKEILTLQAPSREEEKVREYIINKIKGSFISLYCKSLR
jgi:putative aminopeptidase FrvX